MEEAATVVRVEKCLEVVHNKNIKKVYSLFRKYRMTMVRQPIFLLCARHAVKPGGERSLRAEMTGTAREGQGCRLRDGI